MRRLLVLLPVLIAFQAGVQPALAWTWPAAGPVLRPFTLGDDPYAGGQHRGVDIAGANGDADPCSGRRSRELRRHGPRRWARGHGADRHGLLGDARAPGLDRGRAGRGPVRGSDGRRDRPDRRRRAPRALRPSRDTADVGPARLPRSAVVPPTRGSRRSRRRRHPRPPTRCLRCRRFRRRRHRRLRSSRHPRRRRHRPLARPNPSAGSLRARPRALRSRLRTRRWLPARCRRPLSTRR